MSEITLQKLLDAVGTDSVAEELDVSKSDFSGISLGNLRADFCVFDGSKMPGINLRGASLTDCDLFEPRAL